MHARRHILLAVLLFLVSLSIFEFSKTNSPERNAIGRDPSGSDKEAIHGQDAVGVESSLDLTTHRDGTKTRQAIDSRATRFQVTSDVGEPVANTTISWRAVQPLPSGWEKAWKLGGSACCNEPPLAVANTDDMGFYSSPRSGLDSPSNGTSIASWFLKPGWLGEVRVFDSTTESNQWAENVQLEPHTPVTVLVRNEDGTPAAGVNVRVTGALNPSSHMGVEDTNRLLPLARQEGVTDAMGLIQFTALPGLIDVQAYRGSSVALPFRGQCLAQVNLTLQASFSVSGTFTAPDNPSEKVNPRLDVEVRRGGVWMRLDTRLITSSDPWGPIQLPLPENAEEFRLVVRGKPLVTQLIHFSPPQSSEELFFDVLGEIGTRLMVRPIEAGTFDDPDVIHGGRALVTTQSDGQWYKNWIDAEESGTIIITGLPSGQNYYSLFATGYQPVTQIPVPSRVEGEEFLYLHELSRSGVLTGTVLEENQSGDVPSQEFEIVVWPLSNVRDKAVYSFVGANNGKFSISTPPVGDIAVSASTPTRPSPLPETVHLSEGQTVDVELRVPRGGSITGRVLDAETMLPIQDATVQLYVQGPTNPVSPWGAPHNVNADGSFTLEGSVPRENFIYIVAGGYSSRYLSSFPEADGSLVFGDILLSGQSSLTVRVLGLEERSDLNGAELRIGLEGATRTATPVTRLEDDNWGASFPVVNAGSYSVDLYNSDGWLRGIATNIAAHSDVALDLVVGGGATLSVTLIGGTPEQRKAATRIEANPTDAFGKTSMFGSQINQDGPTLLYGITQEQVTLQIVSDGDPDTLGSKRFNISLGQENSVQLPFAKRFFKIHVVDADRNPLPGAEVVLQYENTDQVELWRLSDSEGTALFPDAPQERLRVSLEHSVAGRQLGIEVDGSQDEVTLTLDAEGSLETFVNDMGEPQPGASVTLLVDQSYQLARTTTDSAGKALFKNLAPSTGLLLVSGAGLWEERIPFESGEGKTFFQAPVWRTGSIALTASNPDGAPIPNAQIALEHSATHRKLSDWIGANRVPPKCNRSDASGLFRIPNVPHGQYRYVVTAPGFRNSSGVLDVAPGQLRSITTSLAPEE